MSAKHTNDETGTDDIWPKVLTREEAAKKREALLALARENARPDADENDAASTDSTVAAFILPGGD